MFVVIAAYKRHTKLLTSFLLIIVGIIEDKMLHDDGPEVLITAGAGDIDTLVEPIRRLLNPMVL